MGKAQQRVSRLLEIIIALESGGEWRSVDLAQRFGVSRTRIFSDIRALRQAGVPIQRTGNGYRIDASFFLASLKLTSREVLSLLLPMEFFGQKDGEHHTHRAALGKLIASMPKALQQGAWELLRRTSVVIPSVDVSDDVAGPVREAVMTRRRLKIEYTGRHWPEPQTLEFDPYGLAFRKHAWYAVGLSSLHGEVRKLRLTRISSVELTPLHFTVPADFSLEQCFEGAFYVFSGEPQEVRLSFSPRVARFVRERRPQAVQHLQTLSDGTLLYHCEVNDLDEVAWWIVQYGGDVYVQHPPELRQRVLDIAKGILARHGASETTTAPGAKPPLPYPLPGKRGSGYAAEGGGQPDT
ncbi:transcriptional regulator [bacterium]|nr:transcriptional regulator [bacterium]